jgi:hypothetical protein
MTDTPRTFDGEPFFGYPAVLSATEQPIYKRGYQAGYEIGRCRSDADLAAKDRRIAELEGWVGRYLQRRCKCECAICHAERNKLAKIYDSEPAATPERKQR